LAVALRKIAEAEPLTAALATFPDRFRAALRDALFARLGILPRAIDEDMNLVGAIEEILSRQSVTIDRFFFDWRGGSLRGPGPATAAYEDETFRPLAALLAGRAPAPGALDHVYWSDDAPCTMHIEEVEAIWSAIDEADDWAPLHAKIAAVRRMGEALACRGDANA